MGSNKSFKKIKFEEKILHETNRLLKVGFSDPRLQFISIVKCELSSDCSVAKVYWDTFDSSKKESVEEAIKKIQGRIRSMLASSIKVRHIPEIRFYYDAQYECENAISDILKSEHDLGKTY